MSSLQLFFQVYEREITCSDVVKELSTLIKSASKEALRDAVALYGQTSKVIQYEHVVEKRGRKTKLSARVEERANQNYVRQSEGRRKLRHSVNCRPIG